MNNHDSLAGHAPGCAIRRNGLADCNCDIRLAYPHRLAKVDVTDYEKGFAAGIEAAARVVETGAGFESETRHPRYPFPSFGELGARAIRALAVTPKAVEPLLDVARTQQTIPEAIGCPHARPHWSMCPHCNGINGK